MRVQLAGILGEDSEELVLRSGERDRLPGKRDGVFVEVDPELSDLEHRFAGRRRSAQSGPKPGQQLVDAERLGHVVVGARVECCHLLAVLAHDRENQDGSARPLAEPAADLRSGAVGQDKIEDHGVRRPRDGGCQRGSGIGGRLDLVPRGPQAGLEGAQDLGLVVDDEDAPRAHRADTGTRAAGSETAIVAPCPEPGSTQARPPFTSVNPRTIASPRPLPPLRPRENGSKIRSRSPAGMPGPASVTRTTTSLSRSSASSWIGSSPGENLIAFSITLARARSICAASTRTTSGRGGKET